MHRTGRHKVDPYREYTRCCTCLDVFSVGLCVPVDLQIPEDTMQIPEDTGHKDTKSADYKVVDPEIREGGRMYIIDVSMSFLSYSVFIFGESTLFINKMLNFETKLVD